MRLPSLKFLKTFQIAAQRESFKLAAEELCITPSAVSHQIKSLETQLGIPLFERGPHSLLLTEAGRHYVQALDSIFGRLESVTEQFRMRYGRSVVRLHVPPFFASEMLMPRLQSFMQLRPDVDIHINTVGGSLQSHPAEADLSVVVDAAPADGLASHRLFEQTFVPACSPQLLSGTSIASVEDLDDQTLLIHEARRDGWQRWAERAGRLLLQPRNVVRFDTMQSVVQAAESDIGIALVSSPLTRTRFRSGSLVKLFQEELPTGEAYFLIYRREDSERTEVTALTRWLLSEFARRMSETDSSTKSSRLSRMRAANRLDPGNSFAVFNGDRHEAFHRQHRFFPSRVSLSRRRRGVRTRRRIRVRGTEDVRSANDGRLRAKIYRRASRRLRRQGDRQQACRWLLSSNVERTHAGAR